MNVTKFRDLSWFLSGVLKFMAISLLFVICVGGFQYATEGKQLFNDSFSNGITWFGINTELQHVPKPMIYLAKLLTLIPWGCVLAGLLWLASRIFADFSNGETPFSQLQVKRMSMIARGVLLVAVLQSLVYSIILNILIGKFTTLDFELDSLFVLGLILYCVAGMFSYGVQLQEISDDIV